MRDRSIDEVKELDKKMYALKSKNFSDIFDMRYYIVFAVNHRKPIFSNQNLNRMVSELLRLVCENTGFKCYDIKIYPDYIYLDTYFMSGKDINIACKHIMNFINKYIVNDFKELINLDLTENSVWYRFPLIKGSREELEESLDEYLSSVNCINGLS